MDGVSEDVKRRHIRHCYKADPEYGEGVAKALGIDINSINLETESDETYENFKNKFEMCIQYCVVEQFMII